MINMSRLIGFAALVGFFVGLASVAAEVKITGPAAHGFKLTGYDSEGRAVAVATVVPRTLEGDDLTSYVAKFTIKLDKKGPIQVQWNSQAQQFQAVQQGGQVKPLTQQQNTEAERVAAFVKGLKGHIEKFNIDKSENEVPRLVFRNEKGQFLTWIGLKHLIRQGWNRWENDEAVYEVRYDEGNGDLSGEFINSVHLRPILDRAQKTPKEVYIKYPGITCPAIAVRDTDDGKNNGKFVTVVYGQVEKESGEKWCYYYPGSSPFMTGVEESKLLTKHRLSDLDKQLK